MYTLTQQAPVISSTLGAHISFVFDAEARHASINALTEYIRSLHVLLVSEVAILAHTEKKLTLERRAHIDGLLDKLTEAERVLAEEEKVFGV